jgi:hypothetical protein
VQLSVLANGTLVGALRLDTSQGYDDAFRVRVPTAVASYRTCLAAASFIRWTFEEIVGAVTA